MHRTVLLLKKYNQSLPDHTQNLFNAAPGRWNNLKTKVSLAKQRLGPRIQEESERITKVRQHLDHSLIFHASTSSDRWWSVRLYLFLMLFTMNSIIYLYNVDRETYIYTHWIELTMYKPIYISKLWSLLQDLAAFGRRVRQVEQELDESPVFSYEFSMGEAWTALDMFSKQLHVLENEAQDLAELQDLLEADVVNFEILPKWDQLGYSSMT